MKAEVSLGEYVRRLRRKKKLMLQDLAQKSGLSVSHLSRIENDGAVPNADTVVKIHNVLGGDLGVMLELADCLPREILDRYIRHMGSDPAVLRRAANGEADDPLLARALADELDPRLRRALATRFGFSERDAAGLLDALRRLAQMPPAEREQIIGVLQMATRGSRQ